MQAEPIKVGVVRIAGFAPLYIDQERGYLAAEGVPAEIVTFGEAGGRRRRVMDRRYVVVPLAER